MNVDDDLTAVLERLMRGLTGEWLEKARRFRPVADVPIGELNAHPDLGDRLKEAVRGIPGVEFGVDWVKVNAWNPNVATAEWKKVLRELAARAHAFTLKGFMKR